MSRPELLREVEALIARETGREARVVGESSVGGGSIHRTGRLDLADGRSFFLKQHPSPPPAIFAREAEGLEALAAVGTIRVPGVLGWGEGGTFLLLEHIETGPAGPGFSERFGGAFARLHQEGRDEAFGFSHDNYIGATPQPNAWGRDWPEFWRRHRLGHQLALARSRGLGGAELQRLGERLMERLEELLGEPAEPPTLLHGDLWSGNFLVAAGGEPVLIDPACYYGRREADLAMTQLFGGFDHRFYAAYEEEWPLAPGAEERLAIYELYHRLNHLNLFGESYLGGCLATLRRFA